ncbi:hypothetical protein LXL04_006006 [Taraxacum kok-saghyz]
MDLSKLPDAQRQELEQLQKQFQEHQQKQQEESAAAAAAAASAVQQQPSVYDPSQINQSYDPSQAYDQSYYYNYNYNYQDPSQQHQQYDASYYQNYYPNAYQQQHQYTHPETLVPTAVPSEQQPNAGSGSISLGSGQVQDPYGHPGHQVHQVPPGLNAAAAAAVAALSQLTQFAGTMGAAERANGVGYIPPMTSGGHFVQGHFRPPVGLGHHPPTPYRGGGRRGGGVGRGPAFQGRGRGGGRGRGRGGRHGPPSSSPQPPEGGEKIAWCELCRVDCTSKEILETHKNGKRHQKNLQMKETEKDETEEAAEKKPWMKRKAKGGGGGGGGKRQRQQQQQQQRRVVIPLMCDLCNVKCDTQEVFDRHVGGKKHIAKLKRFQGHQALYGPTAVQALYPPNPLSQSLGPPAPDNPNADAPLQFAQSTTGVQ